MPTFLNLLIVIAVFIVPFVIGGFLARRWRMPDYGWQIGLILFALTAGTVVVVNGFRTPNGVKLGIDLRGGAILVYDVTPLEETEEGKATPAAQTFSLEKTVQAVSRRVNPGGIKEVSVRPFGDRKIEIIIPEADQAEVDRIERQISRAGTLEFRILASRRDSRHDRTVEQGEKTTGNTIRLDQRVIGRWVPVDPDEERTIEGNSDFVTRRDASGRLQVLVIVERSDPVVGKYLSLARPDVDEYGKPSVSFGFNSRGAQLFGRLTSDNLPEADGRLARHLGIILDGELFSAPTIQSTITDTGRITGSFTQTEVEDLVGVLRAGTLEATLSKEPISIQLIGPTLGADTIERSKWAMIASVLVTIGFMIVYYRFAGLVASAAVLTNVLLTVAIMILIKATFTLPGLAGLALTVGMSVDANVLIYERIREELARGAALRMAIRNGFGRAMSAIIDSHITTLMTAIVLYVVGTDQVKGFAVMLFLGISISLFTAVFCARVVFEVAERNRWIKQLKMMQAIKPTNFDVVSTFRPAMIVTTVIALLGIGAIIARGSNILDIDFTSGSSVQLQFDSKHPQQVADVRREAQEVLPPGLVVSELRIAGEEPGSQFLLNTSNPDINDVEKRLTEKFGDKLARNQMTVSDVADFVPSEQKAGTSSAPAADTPATTPPATPAATEPAPAAESPAAPPAAEPKAEEPATPAPAAGESAPNPQSSYRPGDEQLLALADDTQQLALLAQETPPAAEPAKSTETPAATPPAETTPPASTEPAPAKSEQPGAEPPVVPTEAEVEAAAKAAIAGARIATKAKVEFKEPVDHDTLRDILKQVLPDVDVVLTNPHYVAGSQVPYQTWDVQIPVDKATAEQALNKAAGDFSQQVFFPSASKIGASVAASTRQQAVLAVLASLVLIVIYIWIRFQNVAFGLAAIVALAFDVIITLGALAASYYVADYLGFLLIEPFKINLTIIAAFLTIIGYSINDKIVVFDRIREVRGKSPLVTPAMVNLSVNQTLSRTLLTGTTTILVLVILYVTGGDAIHGFAFSLLVGVLVGTYTSIFIGTPVLLWLMKPADEVKTTDQARPAKALPTGTPSRS